MHRKCEDRFVVREGDGYGVYFRGRELDFFGFAGLGFFDGALGVFRGAGADGGFVPVFVWKIGCGLQNARSTRQFVLNIDLGGRIGVGPGILLRIDQGERDFGHAGGLAVAGSGEDDVFHAGATKGLGRLLAQHPGDSVGNIRLAAAVGADDGGDAVPVELEVGAVAKRFEAENLKPLQFKQRKLLGEAVASGQLSVASSSLRLLATYLLRGYPCLRQNWALGSIRDSLRPRLGRAGTNYSNCNGEMGAGSSNITLYIV